MLAWLKILPLKDWLYIGAIAVLVTGFLTFAHHERAIGAAKISTADKALADAMKQHNQDVTDLAAARTAKNGDHYVEVTHAPIPDSPHVVCVKPTSSSGTVPETSGHSVVPDAAANGAAANTNDIGPPLDRTGRDADALIAALQNEIRILVDAMNGKTAP